MEKVKNAERLQNFESSPPHPGKILEKEFLEPLEMTQTELAQKLDVAYPRINEIINGKRNITPETALMLGRVFEVSAEFWLDLQMKYDLYQTLQGPKAQKIKDIESVA